MEVTRGRVVDADLVELEADLPSELDVLLVDMFDGDEGALVVAHVREHLSPACSYTGSRMRLEIIWKHKKN